jgi:hypothetical protein
MAQDFFQECQAGLVADLAEVETALCFLTSAFKTYSKTGTILAHVANDKELRGLITEFRGIKMDGLTLLNQSLYVQVWSAFESFVRGLLTAYLADFSSRKPDFTSLEKYGLARKNLHHTGIALQHIFENRPKLNVDFYLLAKNAATSVPGSPKVELNISTFSLFMSAPSADGLREVLKRIGVELHWDQLGKIDAVQKALRTRGTRETAKQVELYLKESAKRRNNIVHRATNEAITETDVSDAIAVFRALGMGLLQIVKEDCAVKCQ